MANLRFLFVDQLSETISSLTDVGENDVILMCEVNEEFRYVKHHPKKIAFIIAAMRHFAEQLKNKGLKVHYIMLDQVDNSGTYIGEIDKVLRAYQFEKVILTEPSDYRLRDQLSAWKSSLGIKLEVREDSRFLCSQGDFQKWAKGKKQLRMEYFYREMRQKYKILLENDGSPVGGLWNYDKENRKPPNNSLKSPKRISHKKSQILLNVLDLVERRFADHFGDLRPFHYAITRQQAILELQDFIDRILPNFGDHQDAMVKGEAYLNHSLLSSYINVGLLLPLEICQLAENAYRSGKAPLNAVEGFIRQILGWREFIRGIYWLKMPQYALMNYLQAKAPLPQFYWGGQTNMACLKEVVTQTKEHAYSHHIQRLMVTGNFALIAGLDVQEVQYWYLAVYSDAFEWVEMPNTLGMALFGDGGLVGSKPYAASGKYINRMSNFCAGCKYDPNEMLADNACPFNSLYWDFHDRNSDKLRGNMRLNYVYNTWDKFPSSKQEAIKIKAAKILSKLPQGEI